MNGIDAVLINLAPVTSSSKRVSLPLAPKFFLANLAKDIPTVFTNGSAAEIRISFEFRIAYASSAVLPPCEGNCLLLNNSSNVGIIYYIAYELLPILFTLLAIADVTFPPSI